jgi:hypothetical protein
MNDTIEVIEQKIEEELTKHKQDKVEVYLAIFRYIKVLTKIEGCIRNIESKVKGFREKYIETKIRKKKITALRKGLNEIKVLKGQVIKKT